MKIILSKLAKKQLALVPHYILEKYLYWLSLLDKIGLEESRKYKGFHDEPLKGSRKDQRSVRLSKSYRAIYRELDKRFEVIEIIEVNKHDY